MKIKYLHFLSILVSLSLCSINCFADGLSGLGGIAEGALIFFPLLFLTAISFFFLISKRKGIKVHIFAIVQIIAVILWFLKTNVHWKKLFDIKEGDDFIIVVFIILPYVICLINIGNIINLMFKKTIKIRE